MGPSRRQVALEPFCPEDEARLLIGKYESYDADGLGKGLLGRGELLALLTDMSKGEEVDRLEMEWALSVADTNSDEAIEASEVPGLVFQWKRYLKTRTKVGPIFERYATNHSGCLGREELRKLLIELNDGDFVAEEELDLVLDRAGGRLLGGAVVPGTVTKPELRRAISVWYGHVDSSVLERPQVGARGLPARKGGAKSRAMAALRMEEESEETRAESRRGSRGSNGTESSATSKESRKSWTPGK